MSEEVPAEEVCKLCFDKLKSLPKTGKPSNNEWTVLAGVIMHNRKTGVRKVVSLGCGTKSLGKSKLCSQGLILNDSHAEVMARRGLIRYMYQQLNNINEKQCIFEVVPQKTKFQLKNDISLHFLSTQTPCGDACIIAKNESEDAFVEPLLKKMKTDIFDETFVGPVYTGAKLIGSYHNDPMEQIVGAVRIKPGRGERTLSMSCSDKLAKWQIMGVQGALLDFLLMKPIYFDTLTFWGKNNLVSLERAIWKRFERDKLDNCKYVLHIPKVRICNKLDFPYAQSNSKQPAPNSLVWCDLPNDMKPYEIAVNGKRQGVTSKNLQTPQSALKISKFFLFKEFVNITKLKANLVSNEEILERKPYMECKFLAKDYQSAWSHIKACYFKLWSQKPENLLKFSLEKVENKDNDKT